MANPEHVEILKQGVDVWNEWREENPGVVPDLKNAVLLGIDLKGGHLWRVDFRDAILQGAELQGADFREAILHGSNLELTNLYRADFQRAELQRANLKDAYLRRAIFDDAILYEANLHGVDLSKASLRRASLKLANLKETNLFRANLQEAHLQGANLQQTKLEGADFDSVWLSNTQFNEVDISKCLHLEACHHMGQSDISTSTFEKSQGQILIKFLRGCGLSDWEIESVKLYQPNLSNQEIIDINYRIIDIRMTQAIQINPLFISYSHADSAFVDKIGEALTKKGVRYWRDIHNAKAGKLEKQVDRAMRLNPIVLIVLSETSTNSDWVEFEAGKARKLEKELGRDVLCPVAIDDSWKDCDWPGRLRTQIENYNILPFKGWEDQAVFDRMFAKLLGGLDLFYKK